MRIRALFFATYRDLAGADTLEVDLPTGSTAGDLVARLRERDGLAALPAEPALAVNEAHAPLSTGLSDGDEVALLPPVAGG
ncbi:MAG TPA: MoaD/ThiS family protein [Longimicrobiales bacterium]|nr:MoaD/ThiS family protein [Longimicrobiales bacterium]